MAPVWEAVLVVASDRARVTATALVRRRRLRWRSLPCRRRRRRHRSWYFAPDPEFSDEARRAKYQGVCVVSLIVDAQGNPQRVQVVRHLGMGLDEKAVEAVRQYKFKPATLQGKPVPVEVISK